MTLTVADAFSLLEQWEKDHYPLDPSLSGKARADLAIAIVEASEGRSDAAPSYPSSPSDVDFANADEACTLYGFPRVHRDALAMLSAKLRIPGRQAALSQAVPRDLDPFRTALARLAGWEEDTRAALAGLMARAVEPGQPPLTAETAARLACDAADALLSERETRTEKVLVR